MNDYPGINGTPYNIEEEKSAWGLDFYRALVNDPLYARSWSGGKYPAGTKLTILSMVMESNDRLLLPRKTRVVIGDTDEEYTECRYVYYKPLIKKSAGSSRYRVHGHLPKYLRRLGRFAKETQDPRNNKASYFSYNELDQLIRHNDCEVCHSRLERDSRMFLCCTNPKCSLIFD